MVGTLKKKLEDLTTVMEYYAIESEKNFYRIKYMEAMLDDAYIIKCLQKYNESKVYIYGAGYLGIQLYRGLKGKTMIPAIVDKNGTSVIPVDGIKIINIEAFRKKYTDGLVIVTPLTFLNEIRNTLLEFVLDNNIVFVGEFLGE